MRSILRFFFIVFHLSLLSAKVDLITFSFDRDLQLDTFLSSIKHYVTGFNQIYVIYRTSNEYLNEGYEKVKKRHPDVIFHKQLGNPPQDFKSILCSIFQKNSSAPYIMFGIDDMIFIDYVDLKECTQYLEQYKAYGFYLRLGLNFTWCETEQKKQPLPPFNLINNSIFSWRFSQGQYEFRYPNDLSLALYRRSDAMSAILTLTYNTPNQLEAEWATIANLNQVGLSFKRPKLFNLPINQVQQDWALPNMKLYTPLELSKLYHEGFIIDFKKFYQLEAKSCCVNIDPSFTKYE